MNSQTKKKIEHLQKYMRKQFVRWHKIHPENIVGFRIGKKISNGKVGRNYSVIFQVKKKKTSLKEDNIIPDFFKVKFPDGKTRKVKTDVEETGKANLLLAECRKPKNNGKIEVGTAGVILRDGLMHFALTNYHVAANDLMRNQQFRFKGQDNNIFVDGNREVFVDGIFSKEIDAAFIKISNIPLIPNRLGDGTIIKGFLNGPLSPVLMGKEIVIFSKRLRQGKKAKINTNSAIFFTGFQNLSLEDVIQIKPRITEKGDSGGPVIINDDILLGIVVGADELFTYVIPYFKIHNFKPLFIA